MCETKILSSSHGLNMYETTPSQNRHFEHFRWSSENDRCTRKWWLRPKSDFSKKVLGTPAQTALGPTNPWKELPITVVKSGIGRRNTVTKCQKLKSDLHETFIFGSKINFSEKCPDRSESATYKSETSHSVRNKNFKLDLWPKHAGNNTLQRVLRSIWNCHRWLRNMPQCAKQRF